MSDEIQHTCHAIGCTTEVAPEFFACAKHWWMVPAHIRQQIWANYRRGQEVDKRPSQTYLYWFYQAQIAIAEKEKKTDNPAYRRAKELVSKFDPINSNESMPNS